MRPLAEAALDLLNADVDGQRSRSVRFVTTGNTLNRRPLLMPSAATAL
jgi:hypothetical protein